MQTEQVFFNVPLSKLEPIFKRWIKEAQAESKTREALEATATATPQNSIFDEYIPKTEVRGKLASSSTLWNWENKGKLKLYAIGGKRFYKRSDIEALFTEVKKKGVQK